MYHRDFRKSPSGNEARSSPDLSTILLDRDKGVVGIGVGELVTFIVAIDLVAVGIVVGRWIGWLEVKVKLGAHDYDRTS